MGVIDSTFTYNGYKTVLHMRNTWVKLDEACTDMASEHWRPKAQDDDGHIMSYILIACDVYLLYASYFA